MANETTHLMVPERTSRACSSVVRLQRGQTTMSIDEVTCPACRTWWLRNKRPITHSQVWERTGSRENRLRGTVTHVEGCNITVDCSDGRQRKLSGYQLRRSWRPYQDAAAD